jgi:hypothetical protein
MFEEMVFQTRRLKARFERPRLTHEVKGWGSQ